MKIKHSAKIKKELLKKGKSMLKSSRGYIETGKLLEQLGKAEIDYANGVNYLAAEEFIGLPK